MAVKSASPSRILVVAVLILSIVCAVLVGVLIWRAFVYESPAATPAENPTDLRWRFPGYFRTPEEQAQIVQVSKTDRQNPTPVYIYNISTTPYVCYGGCSDPNSTYPVGPTSSPVQNNRRRKRQANPTRSTCALDQLQSQGVQLERHVCCVSYATYNADEYLPSALKLGKTLKIAQGIGNLYQYFETEICCQADGCTVCQCEQTHYVVSAVVEDDDVPSHYYTDWVRVPGCCKCGTNRSNRPAPGARK